MTDTWDNYVGFGLAAATVMIWSIVANEWLERREERRRLEPASKLEQEAGAIPIPVTDLGTIILKTKTDVGEKLEVQADTAQVKTQVQTNPEPNSEPKVDYEAGYKYPKGTYGNLKEFITTNRSPNCNKCETRTVRGIVVHTTEGSGNGAEAWLTNPESKASAHYLIKENGNIVNLVDESYVAWHCRNYNETTIGIEFAGYHDRPLNSDQLDVGYRLIQFLCDKYGLSKKDVRAHSELDPERRKDPGKENMDRILAGIGE